MLPLFDTPEIGGVPRKDYAARLRELAAESIYFGTSSWKYPGWLGSVYSEERYNGRRGFSKKSFESNCLIEYAETFPVVGGDFSFYRFYGAAFWQTLFAQVPDDFQFLLKVPQEITTLAWPMLPRHGALAGRRNPSFLDAALFRERVTDVLEPHRHQVGALIFEFGEFPRTAYPNGARDFVADLAPFLDQLPPGFRYGVEIRNSMFLEAPYFDCLRSAGASHVFNSWTKMPPLSEQLDIADAFTADYSICRALLRPGRSYKQAVQRFEPYERVQEAYPEGRQALATFAQRGRKDRRSVFIVVNNRLEGNSPATIGSVMDKV
jgi:uncharacterized protein YecE (DUF72 family)